MSNNESIINECKGSTLNLKDVLVHVSNGLGDNSVLLIAHYKRIEFKNKSNKLSKKEITTLNAANKVVHFMERKENHNQQYPPEAVELLLRVQCNIPWTDDDQKMILIAHRVRSIVISNPKFCTDSKKYKKAANRIIHYLDKKISSEEVIPNDSKNIILDFFK